MLNMAARIATCGYKVAIASLEQNVFIVPILEKLALDKNDLNNIKIIAPMSMPTPGSFIKLFEEGDYKPDVLFVDHLHYFKRGNRGATEEIDKLVVELQMMANKLEIPVVVASHLRKLNEKGKGKPTLDDLKDSSSLSQIPGVVLLLHRDKNKDENMQSEGSYLSRRGSLLVAKNRVQGKTGIINYTLEKNSKMNFDKETETSIKKYGIETPAIDRDASDDILDS
jgi:RecA-family ATPase